MRFRSLLLMRIRHSFYLDGSCTDLEVRPSAATARLLRGHGWLWRSLPDGLRIAATVGAGGAPERALPEGSMLNFILRLRAPEFSLYTDLPAVFTDGPPLYRLAAGANPPTAGQPAVLVAERRVAQASESLVMPAGLREARFALGGRPKAGTNAAAFVVEGLGAGAVLAWDAPRGSIQVTAAAAAPGGRAVRVTYPVLPKMEPGVFAEIEAPMPAPAGAGIEGEPAYEILFEARTLRWKYFFVTDLPAAQDTFVVQSPGPEVFGRTAPDPADPMTRALLRRFPESGGFRVSCFVSDQPLPCREGPRTGLRLKRGDGEWMEPLPSPPVQNLCLVGDQPGLFHVLTRIAKP